MNSKLEPGKPQSPGSGSHPQPAPLPLPRRRPPLLSAAERHRLHDSSLHVLLKDVMHVRDLAASLRKEIDADYGEDGRDVRAWIATSIQTLDSTIWNLRHARRRLP